MPSTVACGTAEVGNAPGTEASPSTDGTVAAAVAGVAAGVTCSRFQAIHNSTATTIQAKIRNTRVWFISKQARLSRT
jgi:hypothetical protein